MAASMGARCRCASARREALSSVRSIADVRGMARRRTAAARANQAKAHRLEVKAVIPQLQGEATDQAPPDLPSFLFKERIVYLGMSLVPSVTELMMAELLYLQYDSPTKPIYMYINSTGVTKTGPKLGFEAEALAIYDCMRQVKPPIYTVAVGSAFGEAAMLLASGEKGHRAALPSATIMLRQPLQRITQMQATDIDIFRHEIRKTKNTMVGMLSKHIGKSEEEIEKAIIRPKYFDPYAAVDYGIIDRVLDAEDETVRSVMEKSRRGAYT